MQIEQTILISKAAPKHLTHVTWERGANICIHFKLVTQGLGHKKKQGHPSHSESEVYGPWHTGSKDVGVPAEAVIPCAEQGEL